MVPGEFYFSALHWLSNWPFLAKVPPTSQGMQGCTSENVGGELSKGPDPGSGTRSFLKEGAFLNAFSSKCCGPWEIAEESTTHYMMLKDMTKKARVLSALNCRTMTMSFFSGASVLWTIKPGKME